MTKTLNAEKAKSLQGAEASGRAGPDELVFRIALGVATYRVADPIGVDFLFENHAAGPQRTLPPIAQRYRPTNVTYGIRLERLNPPAIPLVDREPQSPEVDPFSQAEKLFRTLARGETCFRREGQHSWLGDDAEGVWPLPEGVYRLTVSFDNRQKLDKRTVIRKAEGEAKRSPRKSEAPDCISRWTAPALEITVAGATRTDPAELLDVIGKKCGRPDLRQSAAKKHCQADADAVLMYGDARLVALCGEAASNNHLEYMARTSFCFAVGEYGWSRESLSVAPKKSLPTDKPAMPGREGRRAFDDRGTYDDHGSNWQAPWHIPDNEMKPLRSKIAVDRETQAAYILVSAAQMLADALNGRRRWQKSFAWGGGMESPIRELPGRLAHALAKKVTAAEALDVAVWLIDNDPVIENQNLGARTLC